MINERIETLRNLERICWEMAGVFLENRDAHGIHDMGVEIQALQRAIAELNKVEKVEKVEK
jgi:hypothetical protein